MLPKCCQYFVLMPQKIWQTFKHVDYKHMLCSSVFFHSFDFQGKKSFNFLCFSIYNTLIFKNRALMPFINISNFSLTILFSSTNYKLQINYNWDIVVCQTCVLDDLTKLRDPFQNLINPKYYGYYIMADWMCSLSLLWLHNHRRFGFNMPKRFEFGNWEF